MKRATNVDTIVGHNIRIQRMTRGLSQQELGKQIGVSFQQMQKYEKGVNRVSSGKLWQLGEVLGVPVESFYTSAENATTKGPSPLALISSGDSFQLVTHFNKIKNRPVRRALVNFVKILSQRT